MRNLWNERDFEASLAGQQIDGKTPRELLEVVYASRLLGRENSLVMHGGGNTSVKCELGDIIGNRVNVIFIKASGVDLAGVDSHDFTPVRIDPMQRLQHLYATGERRSIEDVRRFSTREFKNFLYLNLFDLTDHMVSQALSPSIETLLHAFLPHRFILHTHSMALLTLSNQPDGEELCNSALDGNFGSVPYAKPGLELANSAAAAYQHDPSIAGLVLHKHGLVTFGESAREAYDRMIDAVTALESRIAAAPEKRMESVRLPSELLSMEDAAPIIRGACVLECTPGSKDYDQFILDFRTSPEILTYVNCANLVELSRRGAMTPDFIVRSKHWPLVVPAPDAADPAGFKASVHKAVEAYATEYADYFAAGKAAVGTDVSMLDPVPRVVLVPGLGLFGLGRTARSAAVNADIAAASASAILDAESVGSFESITDGEAFAIEYWEMEQAKMQKVRHGEFAGKVVLVSGGAGGIGLATARAFRERGAEIVLLDLHQDALDGAAEELGGGVLAMTCDVTRRSDVRAAFEGACRRFGGVDIIVSNVGAALQGRIGEVSDEVLRKSFELNFFSHQSMAQEAVRVMKLQGSGGVLLFNVSKQAVNPGPDFGPYGLPKAATMFLVRQYALDHGRDGIRANGINADRIRSGLLTAEMIDARSKARGLSEKEYMAGNLLQLEVTAEDVAEAFVHLALEKRTTGAITTVDGGNIAAALR
ncbi:bifunctional aldolase/short-chain dehydrogenase [Chlorobium phaeovibrioides]|uniref:Bifunctional aldolase/short-chain dehydrogenase n=1 Tax=Chlorobium phaeovibrioides TaxID=1094 RepID=A0A5M8I9R1_CHLPH|nr:bifunctional aldolase/short-chain dehydrogenase [Chlorobium phaeovibrioides]KAA6232121.1 bifunctional aldolase/short-chain dehydrogenase [Chlorobium phaeovibrioides]